MFIHHHTLPLSNRKLTGN